MSHLRINVNILLYMHGAFPFAAAAADRRKTLPRARAKSQSFGYRPTRRRRDKMYTARTVQSDDRVTPYYFFVYTEYARVTLFIYFTFIE